MTNITLVLTGDAVREFSGGGVQLIATKFERPPSPSNAVTRPRLVELLASSGAPFTLVVAGPGYGKTVVVGQWLDASDGAVAWVSLDAIDDVSTVFWRYVAESIRRSTGQVGAEALRMLDGEQAPYSVLTSLLAELAELVDPLVVLLDDLHVIRSAALVEEVAFFVERLPRTVRVVATSRVDPPLPLGRWRVSGRLCEVRQHDLEFRTDEALAMFAQQPDVIVEDDDVAFLTARTEGWAAGLQLAALSLQGRADAKTYIHSALADDRVIADYLVGEVLDRLSEADRGLVLDLSVLDDFDIDLANAVTGHDDVAYRVRSMESRNLFLLPVDEGRERFRFHHLLRELLERELRWRSPDRARVLHERAADHLESIGAVREAVGHLIAAGQLDEAYRLVAEPAWQHLDDGNVTAARQWLGSFPRAFLEDDPTRVLNHVALLTTAGQVDTAYGFLCRLEDRGDLAALTPFEEIQRVALKAIFECIRGDLDSSRLEAQRCLDLLADGVIAGPVLVRFAGVMVRNAIFAQDLPGAEHWLGHSGDPLSEMLVLSDIQPGALAARVAVLAGRLDDAEHAARGVLDLAEQHHLRVVTTVGEGHIALAQVLLERGELGGAELHAGIAAEVLSELTITVLEAEARLLAVAAATARFGAAGGLALLAVTRTAFGDRHVGTSIVEWFDLAECRLRLLAGDRDTAQVLLDELPPSTEHDLLAARAAMIEGRFDEVASVLRDADGWPVAARMEAHTLLARSCPVASANEHVRLAASLAVQHQLLHTFLREGPDLLRMARRAHREAPSAELAEIIALAQPRTGATERPTFIDPLTDREHTLLELLPTHLTYQEMANELCVSINTVKTYQKTVFRKLNATSRSEAVSIARTAHLINGTN
jgi:LuxR family maltose regulon positive regulatory protein